MRCRRKSQQQHRERLLLRQAGSNGAPWNAPAIIAAPPLTQRPGQSKQKEYAEQTPHSYHLVRTIARLPGESRDLWCSWAPAFAGVTKENQSRETLDKNRDPGRLFVEPGVLEAPAVIVAVDHHRVAYELGLPAGSRDRVEDDRTGAVLCQLPFDFPDDLLAFARIGFHRLPIDQLVRLGTAISGTVPLGPARVVLIKLLVGVVEAVLADRHPDRVILAHDLGIPLRSVDGIEHAVDIDLFQLIDQQHCRIAIGLH